MNIAKVYPKRLKLTFWILCIPAIIVAMLFAFEYHQTNGKYPVDLGGIEAYTQQTTYKSGALIPIYIHSKAKFRGSVYQIKDSLVPTHIDVSYDKVIQDNLYDPNSGLNWESTFSVDSKGWSSGYYLFRFENENEGKFDLIFLITPSLPKEISIVASTNTWQAYNSFGGRSNYTDMGFLTKHFRRVSRYLGWNFYNVALPHRRPYLKSQTDIEFNRSADHHYHVSRVVLAETPLVHFLDKRNIEYGVYGDFDFAFDPHILQSKLIVFHNHSEYWSDEMINRLEEYIETGGKVIFLSGNNIYRKVKFTKSGLQMIDQKIDAERVRKLIGAFYSRDGYKTYAPYEVAMPEHWVFAGQDLIEGDVFGSFSSIMGKGGSGMEMDITGKGSEGFSILAKGQNANAPAEMVFTETPQGGWVFNASSVVFEGCLSQDPVVDGLMGNLIKDAIGREAKTE